MVRSIGADHVIDYTQEDLAQSAGPYDLIFDAVRERSFADSKCALKPERLNVITEFSPGLALQQQ